MGATSVTGVGQGPAEGNKGPMNNRQQFVPLLTPHVVCAGTVTTDGGTGAADVVFPTPLTGSETGYVVLLTVEAAAGAGHEVAVTAKTDDADDNFASFSVITTVAGEDIMWVVITAGVA